MPWAPTEGGAKKHLTKTVCLQEIDGKFGFLLDMEGLCFKAETSYLKERCEKFGEAYSCDVDGQELYEKILDFRTLLTTRTEKISSPEQLLNFIVQYGDENVFPNSNANIADNRGFYCQL